MTGYSTVEELISLFECLQNILESHQGGNHIAGIRLVISQLSDKELPVDVRIFRAMSIYKSMMGGMGTLGDFVIWNENEVIQNALNIELNELLTRLWEKLGC